MVRATLAALVPCSDGLRHAGPGTGPDLDDVSATALAACLLFHSDPVADRRNPDSELYVSKLSCSRDGCVSAGRSLRASPRAREVEGASSSQQVQSGRNASHRTRGLEGEA